MKKLISVLLAALLLAGLSPAVLAAEDTYDLYFTFDKEYYEVGDTVTATVHLDRSGSAEPFSLRSFETAVYFAKTYLCYVDSSANAGNNAAFRVTGRSVYGNATYDTVSLSYHYLGGTPLAMSAANTVAVLQFTALKNVASEKLIFSASGMDAVTGGTLRATDGVYRIGKPAPTYAVTFANGGGTGTDPKSDPKAAGDTILLPGSPYTRSGYTFGGWSDGAAVYKAGDTYTMPAKAVTFTAVWTKDPVPHAIRYDAASGTGTAPAGDSAVKGTRIVLPTAGTLTRTGYVFAGWSYSGKTYQPGDTFEMPDADVTFTAVWTKYEDVKPISGSPSGGASAGEQGTVQTSFADVPADAWFAPYVQYVSANGLMAGVGAGQFAPNTPITRGMVVTILYRAAGTPAVQSSGAFTDVPGGTWYTDSVAWAAENQIISGYGNGSFGPNDVVTREQLMAILWRWLGSQTAAQDSLSQFPDAASVSSYAAGAARWAVSKGIVSGMDGRLNPGGDATRAQFASIITRILTDG